MSETIETAKPLGQRAREAYDAARARPGAPWAMLDAMFNQVRVDLGRINAQVCATFRPISEATAETMREATLIKAEAEFCRWRDMSESEARHAAYLLEHPAAPPENVELSARNLVDQLRELGVRFDVGTKGALSLSPARLVPERDRANVTRLKAAIVAEVERRADVWHV